MLLQDKYIFIKKLKELNDVFAMALNRLTFKGENDENLKNN